MQAKGTANIDNKAGYPYHPNVNRFGECKM